MVRRLALSAAVLLFVSGCSDDASTTTPSFDIRIVECSSAAAELEPLLNDMFDRLDADPTLRPEDFQETQEDLSQLFFDLGFNCDPEGGRSAYSEVFVYVAGQSLVRPPQTTVVVESLLQGFCAAPRPFDLTPEAQTACDG